MKYRSEIDGLRALAVLPVILFHAGFEWFGGGFVGVDVFFVISGYLITTIIISEMAEGKFSILNFYERRARRILPALFFVMAACLPFAWLWLTPNDLKDFGQSLISVSTFSSNILFWLESGYFDTAAELKPLLHTWSLAVEEQYYILFPVFLMLTWRLGIKWVLVLLSVVFLLSLGVAQWGAYNNPSATFFLLPTRGWELLVGVFAALYLKYNTQLRSHILNQALSLLGFGMIVYSIIAFDETTPFPSLYTLIPTIGTGLIILCAVPKTYIHKLLSLKFIVGIGLISYSTYLWHQPLLAFARHRFLGELSELILIALCLISLVMAWFSWKFVEAPFRNRKTLTRKKVFLFSILCMVLFSSLGISMHLNNGYEDRVSFSEELANSFKRPSLENCFNTPFNHSAEEWGCILGRS
jgi:peptidoglycan/LPS O-acetylase OafA/YrhL